ncbi:hypothetical protein T09_13598 [Trichinella sp. T9]|nr:hypothetical protein T09_13598 [Trichinella sp. T9]
MSGCLYRKCQPQLCRFAGNTKDLRGYSGVYGTGLHEDFLHTDKQINDEINLPFIVDTEHET